ncbi:hypothetical protein BDQ12DRAFT_753176 [Crucibulum laeve]|uniref:Uncharacterized protein n=1 Tax=Crucibulum laeve TaxID=68775 RepID=A0A5C3LVN4_9AGAR|nr:hypothetical protein BDQ12DRAFT_753176 [Crucibulum laeve]
MRIHNEKRMSAMVEATNSVAQRVCGSRGGHRGGDGWWFNTNVLALILWPIAVHILNQVTAEDELDRYLAALVNPYGVVNSGHSENDADLTRVTRLTRNESLFLKHHLIDVKSSDFEVGQFLGGARHLRVTLASVASAVAALARQLCDYSTVGTSQKPNVQEYQK